ncbi:MAG: BMC domain-containing protein [Candidatus Coatesbacteria bacterium]|nr:MAG: BMC domain-containing protein [Candidatus Coatesbacteria bacterium]
MEEAIGLVEFSSIARGIEAVDAMVKEADVRLLASRTSCSGKYLGLVAGAVAAVKSAVAAGVARGAGHYVDEMVIPNVHDQVLAAAAGTVVVPTRAALGIIETFSLASALWAADAAVKAAPVTLVEVRLGTGIGGKGFTTMVGETAAVRAAVAAGAAEAERRGLLVATAVIPAPYQAVLDKLI